jgi:hypothetical protein
MKRVGERTAQISGLKVPMTNDSLISAVDGEEALRWPLEGLLKSLGHVVAVPPIAHGDDDVVSRVMAHDAVCLLKLFSEEPLMCAASEALQR